MREGFFYEPEIRARSEKGVIHVYTHIDAREWWKVSSCLCIHVHCMIIFICIRFVDLLYVST